FLLAWRTGDRQLYFSAALTLALKMALLPWLLHRLIRRLQVYWDTEPLLNISGTMLAGIVVVVFAFGLAQPISQLATTSMRNAIGIAVATILLAFLMMITRRKAMSQVMGFLSMENGLFFGAMSATYGMPMIIELGIALDVLVAVFVLGIFFFQIREQFDSLDLHHLERLSERQ
ncbi:MAG: formate hydrogenlyase, partial [Proteobacteria bacterium]|nr:formate hydrogenlyase [Pseudomonadota bacterium]